MIITNKEEEILFSKYRILKVLKKSDKNRVLLAVNHAMGSKRIIKEVLRDEEGYESLQSEVSILKHLNFSGIPVIYDVEETEKYYYIVEEYIQGRTLSEIIQTEGVFDVKNTVFYGRQLAYIVSYLHSVKPDAVLHLDIQPKNIMIHDRKLYLIDFGNASYSSHSGEKAYLKGTQGFAAPEQYQGSGVDVRTDIYGIGACLCFMLTGIRGREGISRVPEYMSHILSGCMEENKKNRFASADLLSEKLNILEKQLIFVPAKNCKKEKNNTDRNNINDPIIISFAGTQSRIGTSVLAMAFTEYLVRQGTKVLYEENNETEMVRKIVRKNENIRYGKGNFYYQGIPIRPFYNSKKIRLETSCKVIIRDEGVFDEKKEYGSRLILVAGIRSWEEDYTALIVNIIEKRIIMSPQDKILWIWNMNGGQGDEKYMPGLGVSGYDMPYLSAQSEGLSDIVYKKIAQQLDIGT